jgi:hypothetical protein
MHIDLDGIFTEKKVLVLLGAIHNRSMRKLTTARGLIEPISKMHLTAVCCVAGCLNLLTDGSAYCTARFRRPTLCLWA